MWIIEIISIVLWLTMTIGIVTAVMLGIVMWTKKSRRRKTIRYLRWFVKAAFLLVFMIPIAYLLDAPVAPVYSFFSDPGLSQSLATVPLGQSPDVIWLYSFGVKASGARIVCPLWGVQYVIAGVAIEELIPTIVALLLFLVLIIVLGNMFCGWVCPLGTIIDSFDGVVTKLLPKVDQKRVERSMQDKEMRAKRQSQSNNIICPSCPVGKLSGRYGIVANGVIVSSFVGSAALGFPVFCTICPIGIATRGVSHLLSVGNVRVTGKFLPILIELWAIPVIAVIASLRERRFWCKKICPVGALLNVAGAFNPFFKPTVNVDKCRIKGCPKDCEDYKLDYCFMCRQIDQRQCEKVCPVDINLTDKESLARCTKCFECYIACDRDALEIKLSSKPDAVSAIARFFKRKREYNPATVAIYNEISLKSGTNLKKLKLDAQEFNLKSIAEGNINCFVVRDIERTKRFDRYYAEKITYERILAKDRIASEYVEIPVTSVGYGLRSSSRIKTIDVTNREDFIILSEFRDASKICPGITNKTLECWKQEVKEKAANLLIARRFDLPAFNLSALAFYSDNPIVGVNMWSIKGLSKEEAMLQALWFNSTPNLLQIYVLQTSKAWRTDTDYKLDKLNFLNMETLSPTQTAELMNLFKEVCVAEMPSILTQLEQRHPLRVKLDVAILKVLGYGLSEAVGILDRLYPLLLEEIRKMKIYVADE